MTWLAHVKATMKREAGKKVSMGKKWFKHVLKTAKHTYKGKKGHRGGEEPPAVVNEPAPGGESKEEEGSAPGGPGGQGGRRRRHGSKKTRRVRKH